MFCLGEKQARKYDKNAILVALDKQNPKNNLYVVKEHCYLAITTTLQKIH